MTLLETINLLNWVARNQPNINGVVESGDIYDLNKDEYQQKYSAFCATQNDHEINESWSRYSFTLYYVDRLTNDKNNKEEIQSTAVSFFQNYTAYMIKNFPQVQFNSGTVVTFTEKFSAECAGAYMECDIITTPQSLCPNNIQSGEPITITTYEFKGEIEYYKGNWDNLVQGGNYPGSYTGQSTYPLDYDILFNEIHFPLRISNVNNVRGERVMYCVLKGKYIEGNGSSSSENQFLPCYGYPFFTNVSPDSSRPNDAYREPIACGYIEPKNIEYDDFTIKLDKTYKLNAGETVILLLRSDICYVYLLGRNESIGPALYEYEGKRSLYQFTGYEINIATLNSPFNISWYRYHPSSMIEDRYVACQPVLKLTTYQ